MKRKTNLQLKQKTRLSVELEDNFYSWFSSGFGLSLAKMPLFSFVTLQGVGRFMLLLPKPTEPQGENTK